MPICTDIKSLSLQGRPKLAEVQYPVGMGEVLTGTTIMAVQTGKPDSEGRYPGVVIGADSRTSSGTYVVNRVTDKLTKITDKIYACRSGSAADTQAIVDIVRYYMRTAQFESGQEPLVETAAKLCQDLCYKYKNSFMAGLIVAGHDSQQGGQVYCIPLGGTLVRQPWTIGGSGSSFIYGLCDNQYKESMSTEESHAFVRKCVSSAVKRDGSSGGVVRTAHIHSEGVNREIFNMETQKKFQTENAI